MKVNLANRIAACLVATCMAAEPAFAAQTDISNTPLGASAGAGFLPNLLFILDDSGSMASDYNPDYVNDSNTCMRTSGGSTNCQRGDPPYEGGGQNGFNGVGYDPNFTYLNGVSPNGQPFTNPPSGTLDQTQLVPDAYLGGSKVDITQIITDKRFCNPNNVCKRNGANNSTALLLPAGFDDAAVPTGGHALAAGQFPYRTNGSNSSATIFGLPEMMSQGTFSRSGSVVTVNTFAPHGLTVPTAPTADRIYTTGTGTAGVDLNLVAVASVPSTTQFTFTSTSSGTLLSGAAATFARSGSTVTVTSTGHGLANGAIIAVSANNVAFNTSGSPVTVVNSSTFTYTAGSSGTIGSTPGNWTRLISFRKQVSGLWNTPSGGTVRVTSNAHGLAVGDRILVTPSSSYAVLTNVNVTAVTANTFDYSSSTGSGTDIAGYWVRTGLYNQASTVNGVPMSYSISPIEWCKDVNLTDCKEIYPLVNPNATPPANKPSGADAAYSNPAYVRFCRSQFEALAPGAVSVIAGTPPTPRCQLKFVNLPGLTPYIYPRYGWFNRDTIASGLTFKNRLGRTDCITSGTAPDCTYNEEIQNYAKWYTYYRTRMQMMKTSAGRAFQPFISAPTATPVKPDRLRVGFITINPTFRNSNNNSTAPNVDSSKYLRIDTFNNVVSQANNWYNTFYAIIPNNSTPLRLALSRAGWIFAGKLDTGLTTGIPAGDDPIQVSCQKNYAFLTTDGFWNQGVGQDLGGNDLGNQDNVPNDSAFPAPNPYVPPASGSTAKLFVSRGTATYDGAVSSAVAGTTPGGSGTLADIAMYYYRTDLRGGTDLATPPNTTGPAKSPNTTPPNGFVDTNNVTASGDVDFATHQHMNTFAIGLADGLMRYQKDYATNPSSDYFHIVNADVGACFWNGAATCNWPLPTADGQSALDDLWHAAVNGRGSFYSAVNPAALADGLSSALNALDINVASAAAAATSSPQVAQGNATAFSTTYQTATWSGEVYAQKILPTGEVDTSGANNGKLWEGHKLLVKRVGNPVAVPPLLPDPSPRVIKTFDVASPPASATKLKDFSYASLSSTLPTAASSEQAQFSGHCLSTSPTPLSQCGSLTPIQKGTANSGDNLVKFLGGDPSNELSGGFGSGVYRDRSEQDQTTSQFVQTVLGDIINSQPVAVGAPFNTYENEGGTVAHAYPKTPVPYSDPLNPSSTAFKEVQAKTRAPFLLVGANEGFLHSFDQASGQENWAYAPRFLLPNLWQLADRNYPGQHRFFVDGSPEVADVFDVNANAWKTIVVGGLNSGGRGYYALDVTTPLNPKGLWEFCSDSTWCPNDAVGSHSDPDLGFSYGNPVIGRRDSDGRWVVVVTSGLNNVSPGDGKGYFYVLDAITGKILHKIRADDGTGSITSPSGLMKIGAYYPVGLDDPNFTHVYGGDQKGHIWRLDVSTFPSKQSPAPAPMVTYAGPTDITTDAHYVGLLANLQDSSGRIQPVTARPAGTHLGPDPGNPKTRIYYVGTGRYIGNSDLSDQGPGNVAWQQSIYGIRDQLDKSPVYGGSFVANANFRNGNVVQQFLGPLGANRTITKNPVDWTTQDGFFIDLNPHFPGDPPEGNSPGERVFLDIRLILGTLLITSNWPNTGGACVAGGHSFQYGLDYRTGGYIGNDATAPAGQYVKEFLVGSAIEQTSDGTLKALNKSITGQNLTTPIPTDINFSGKRFSYRER